jgi:hypothetical protein
VQASVVKWNAGTAEARTSNDILVVFRCPAGLVSLSDVLELDLNLLDTEQDVLNLTRGKMLRLKVETQNVHDLRLPAGHGTSRFPSLKRRGGA